MLVPLPNHTKTPVSHNTIITDTQGHDAVEMLFEMERITKEQWQLTKKLRRLAYHARRSQGVRMRLQSHSQHWGMPNISGNDDYENKRAERKWKLFLLYTKPFIEHHWLDAHLFNLIVLGGAVLESGKNNKLTIKSIPFTTVQLDHAFQIIEYVYEKAHQRR